jgi:hypothetical protein
LRVAFNDLMARIPVASDVEHVPTTIGGVNAVDITIRGIDTADTIVYFHGGVYFNWFGGDISALGERSRPASTFEGSSTIGWRLSTRTRRQSTTPAPPKTHTGLR